MTTTPSSWISIALSTPDSQTERLPAETPIKDTIVICNFNSYLCQDFHRKFLPHLQVLDSDVKNGMFHPNLSGSAAAEPATGDSLGWTPDHNAIAQLIDAAHRRTPCDFRHSPLGT
jgi:hypothetical protein